MPDCLISRNYKRMIRLSAKAGIGSGLEWQYVLRVQSRVSLLEIRNENSKEALGVHAG